MSKDFYVIKLDITEIHYYVTLIKCRKKIAIMSRVRISKTSSKMSSYLKVWSFCVHSFAIKWWPFQFLAKFLKIAIYLVDVFWLRKHQVYVLINVRNIHKRQRSSGKFRLHKPFLYDNQYTKMIPSHFWYFHCSSFKMTFDENVMKEATISQLLPNFCSVTKYYVLITVGS